MKNLGVDIFCQVVDNYGDIGVCWRLSKQLSAKPFNAKVRLWVNDLNAFKKLQPDIKTEQKTQIINNIEIITWSKDNHILYKNTQPRTLVIEAFACELPPEFKAKLHPKYNIWLNLEYLSAQTWVTDFHLQPSPQTGGMTKHFFMPGFTNGTGGLIREHNLKKTIERQDLLPKLGLDNTIDNDDLLIMYFCYPNAPMHLLIDAISQIKRQVAILIPQGLKVNLGKYSDFNLIKNNNVNKQTKTITKSLPKNLTLNYIPFVDQDTFDQILFNCDINFVRGEDSLIRAIWAQKPFIWQPYIQDQGLHLEKLKALLDISPLSIETQKTMLKWSTGHELFSDYFSNLINNQNYKTWRDLSAQWSRQLASRTDLATALFDFVTKRGCDIR